MGLLSLLRYVYGFSSTSQLSTSLTPWMVSGYIPKWVGGVHYPSIFKYTVYSTYLILASKKHNQIILFFVSRLKNQLAHRINGFWGPRHGVLRLQEIEGFIAQSCFWLHRAFRRHKNKDKHMEHMTDTISGLASVTSPTTCTVVITWVASGLRLPRREVGRWPLSNWAVQFSRSSSADHRVCGPIAFGVPLPLSSDLCFDFDWPSGGCLGIFRGSVVRPSGCFSPFGEKSVPWHGTDVRSLSTWHHRQLPLEDDTWTRE